MDHEVRLPTVTPVKYTCNSHNQADTFGKAEVLPLFNGYNRHFCQIEKLQKGTLVTPSPITASAHVLAPNCS